MPCQIPLCRRSNVYMRMLCIQTACRSDAHIHVLRLSPCVRPTRMPSARSRAACKRLMALTRGPACSLRRSVAKPVEGGRDRAGRVLVAPSTCGRRRPLGRRPLGRTDARRSGRLPLGRLPLGRSPLGRPPLGRLPLGSPPLGRSPLGRLPHGCPPHGRPPLGRPPHGRPPLGRSPHNDGRTLPHSSRTALGVVVLWCTCSNNCARVSYACWYLCGSQSLNSSISR